MHDNHEQVHDESQSLRPCLLERYLRNHDWSGNSEFCTNNNYSILIHRNWQITGTVNGPHSQAIWVHLQNPIRAKVRPWQFIPLACRPWCGLSFEKSVSSLLPLLNLGYWILCYSSSLWQSVHQFRSLVVYIDLVLLRYTLQTVPIQSEFWHPSHTRGEMATSLLNHVAWYDMQITTEKDTRPNQSRRHPHS